MARALAGRAMRQRVRAAVLERGAPRSVPRWPRESGRRRRMASAAAAAVGAGDAGRLFAGLTESASAFSGGSAVYGFHGRQVTCLSGPREFYDALLRGVSESTRDVTLCALYLGTGPKSRALVEAVALQCRKHPALRVQFLFDASRGTRGRKRGASSACLLAPLLAEFPDRVTASFYTMPLLERLPARAPSPLDEVIAVSHLKAMVFDDAVLLTGANLSEDYFTDRMDRYVRFADAAPFASYWSDLVRAVARFSSSLTVGGQGDEGAGGAPRWQLSATPGARRGDRAAALAAEVAELQRRPAPSAGARAFDTWALPTFLEPAYYAQDARIACQILEELPAGAQVQLSSAYWNPTEELLRALAAAAARGSVDVLSAAPRSHGFSGARGVKKLVPHCFHHVEEAFLARMRAEERRGSLRLSLWERDKWTFHGKGLWLSSGAADAVEMTVVGSSNFGVRSFRRDMEAQAVLLTSCPGLQQRLAREAQLLWRHARTRPDDRGGEARAREPALAHVAKAVLPLVRSYL